MGYDLRSESSEGRALVNAVCSVSIAAAFQSELAKWNRARGMWKLNEPRAALMVVLLVRHTRVNLLVLTLGLRTCATSNSATVHSGLVQVRSSNWS